MGYGDLIGMTFIFFFIILGWYLLAFIIGKWGKTRKIGFIRAFLLGLHPVVGIIAVLCSKKLSDSEEKELRLKRGGCIFDLVSSISIFLVFLIIIHYLQK